MYMGMVAFRFLCCVVGVLGVFGGSHLKRDPKKMERPRLTRADSELSGVSTIINEAEVVEIHVPPGALTGRQAMGWVEYPDLPPGFGHFTPFFGRRIEVIEWANRPPEYANLTFYGRPIEANEAVYGRDFVGAPEETVRAQQRRVALQGARREAQARQQREQSRVMRQQRSRR